MSLGFGFSLPALAQYGGGGTNPFGQLGPTLDLSFTGTAGNLSGTDTYTLDTNFITPQYQIAAQYAVWTATGLTQVNFADVVTFTRGSNATQFDSTGSLVYAPVNLLTWSEDFGNAAWVKQNGATITTDAAISPAGTQTADRLQISPIQYVYNQVNLVSGVTYTVSIFVKTVSGGTQFKFNIFGAGNNFVSGNQTATASWQRYSYTFTATGTGATSIYLPIVDGLSAAVFDVWGAQINPSPMVDGVTSSLTTYYPTTTTAYYGPRFDYNPSTLAAQGLLIEEQRTNSIRNNTMQGAVAGTPGTGPTNWALFIGGTGISRQIVGTGIENGITYIDIRYFGTATTNSNITISAEPTNGVAAANGQTWTFSAYVKIAAGSFTGLNSPEIIIEEYSSAPGYLTGQTTSVPTPTGTLARISATRTNTNASTAFEFAGLRYYINNGNTIDVTFRIGLPQLEQGAFATSVIPTTTTALTRSADVASVNTLSPWYNATEGTLCVQGQRVGSTTASTFPRVASLNDNTANNEIAVLWATASSRLYGVVVNSAVTQADVGYNSQTQTTSYKSALAYKANDFAFTANAQTVQTDASGTIPTVDRLAIGNIAGVGQINAWIQRLTYYPRRLPNADLQTITA